MDREEAEATGDKRLTLQAVGWGHEGADKADN